MIKDVLMEIVGWIVISAFAYIFVRKALKNGSIRRRN